MQFHTPLNIPQNCNQDRLGTQPRWELRGSHLAVQVPQLPVVFLSAVDLS